LILRKRALAFINRLKNNMKKKYILAIFLPIAKNKYAGQHKWVDALIGLDDEPIINNRKQVIYRISPFWKAKQMINDKNVPPFSFVDIDDLQPATKPINNYGTFQCRESSKSVSDKLEDCEILGDCCSFLFD